jgi:uncharacterized protein
MTSLPDGTLLLFNFYTLKLIPFNPSDAPLVDNILKNPGDSQQNQKTVRIKKLLKNEGFLINDEIVEIDYLKQFHYRSRNRQNRLNLTILPSLECNFRCTYCYENKDERKMGPEVEEALIRFVKHRLKDFQQNSYFSVTWFGGEPMMQMDIIERLSRAFIKMSEEKAVQYSADMITNGYLLTKRNIKKLKGLQIKKAQVTLDGPPRIHDQRRSTVNGGKTFRRILENIKKASPEITIRLRINVDDTNREHIQELLDLLVKEGLEQVIHPYLGRTYPYTEICGDVAGDCLTDMDFSLLELETQMELVRKGFHSFQVPQARNIHCLADNNNAFVITPSGGIVNCWNDASNPNAEIGHLIKPFTEKMRQNAEKWLKRNPFELECAACLLLPICMGGCPYLHLTTGKLHCHDWRPCPNENLAFYYYIKRMQQEGEIIREFRSIVETVKELKIAAESKK